MGFFSGLMGGGGGGEQQVIYQPAAAAPAPLAAASISEKASPTPVGGEEALKAKRAKTSSLLSSDTGSTLLGG
jgi:hypothetical protein